ncbi:MAG: reverse transcriptase family protein [Bacteroidota bacterium]
MFDSVERRQQLYNQIRKSSKEEFILEEMIRLGFWPDDVEQPSVPSQLIRKESALTHEIRELNKEARVYENPEALLRKIHKGRMAASKRKQAETKVRREEKRKAKAEAWKERKSKEILFLGEEVSAGLGEADTQEERLQKYDLPPIFSAADLASRMGTTVNQIRFLAFSRKVSKVHHYKRFLLPKKRGGHRLISAPMPRLKQAQYWILEELLYKIPVHQAAHGFVHNKSILSNARKHIGQDVVINLDLKDFFPSVNYPRIRGLFRALGFSEAVATILGLLCTEAEVEEVILDDQLYYVATSERKLPQGSPTSPALTNILCRRLDRRLEGIARKKGFVYTRYADDLTFSASGEAAKSIQALLWQIKAVIRDEGFELHPEKLRIMHKGSRQEVTGLIVNERLGIPRKHLRNFKSLLFQIEQDGLKGKHWRGSPRLLASLRGYAQFVAQVEPEKGQQYVQRAEAICHQYGYKHEIRFPAKQKETVIDTAATTAKRMPPKQEKSWWKFWEW